MKKALLFLAVVLFFIACSHDGGRPQNALDTGTAFIRASLDGNFADAESLLLKDTQNTELFERYKEFYADLKSEQKEQYKKASYEINKYTEVNDSTATINYSNSYMHKPMDIKIVRVNKVWSVDFKYTYAP